MRPHGALPDRRGARSRRKQWTVHDAHGRGLRPGCGRPKGPQAPGGARTAWSTDAADHTSERMWVSSARDRPGPSEGTRHALDLGPGCGSRPRLPPGDAGAGDDRAPSPRLLVRPLTSRVLAPQPSPPRVISGPSAAVVSLVSDTIGPVSRWEDAPIVGRTEELGRLLTDVE